MRKENTQLVLRHNQIKADEQSSMLGGHGGSIPSRMAQVIATSALAGKVKSDDKKRAKRQRGF